MYLGHYFIVLILFIVNSVYGKTTEKSVYELFEHEFGELKALVGELEGKIKATETTNSEFAIKLSNAEKTIADLTNGHLVARRDFTEAQVAFYAKLGGSLHGLGPHQTVIFDELVTNTSAKVYDTSTGIFTAPVSGMYVISWTANVNHHEAQSTELIVNGRPKAWSYADTAGTGDGDYGSASQTVPLEVQKNEHVWVRTGTSGKGEVHGADYSTFSAFLLFPMSS